MRTVLAVDGGNSKTDVAIVGADGTLLGAIRGGSVSHQAVGLEDGMRALHELVASAWAAAGLDRPRVADVGAYTLAGADTTRDVRRLEQALAAGRFASTDLVRNDAFAILRAGTDRGWGVGIICGAGVGAVAVGPDGRTARMDALGEFSGDWGGGTDVGWAAVAAAARARDGRGPATSLARVVPEHFGLRSPSALTAALYSGRISAGRVRELSPVVFAEGEAGDAVARTIIDRLADEIVVMAGALIRRLRLRRLDPEIVLGGGVFRAQDAAFYGRIEVGLRAVVPAGRVVRLRVPPVAGAALIGLDGLGVAGVGTRVRAALADWDASIEGGAGT